MPTVVGLPSGSVPVVILGNDAVLAALPAHPFQLAHACHAAGFHTVVPASWGDELVAAATIRETALRARGPVVTCACPLVRARLCGATNELASFLFEVVAPPIAAARYVRRLFAPATVHLTYVGACKAGGDAAFDAWISPDDLFSRFQSRGVVTEMQSLTFDDVVPPDRSRHYSIPGGAPSQEALAERGAPHELAVLCTDDVVMPLAELLLGSRPTVVDAAPALGCACAGGSASGTGRAALTSLEPPRALTPVLDARILVDTAAPLTPPAGPEAVLTSERPTVSRDSDVPAPVGSVVRAALAITPPRALEAVRTAGAPSVLREFWRRPAVLQPPVGVIPDAPPSMGATHTAVPMEAAVDAQRAVITAPGSVPPRSDPAVGLDRSAPESVLRRSPMHVRRVPPPLPARGRSVGVALLLAAAAFYLLRYVFASSS